MSRWDCPSWDVMGAAIPAAPEPPAPPPRPVGNQKLVRVGGKDILLSRGDRKRILRKLVQIGIERGDTLTQTPNLHQNRRSQRDA